MAADLTEIPPGPGWPRGHWLSDGALSCSRHGCRYSGGNVIPKGARLFITGEPGAVLCEAHERPRPTPARVTREAVAALGVVHEARKLVRALCEAKSAEDRPWTQEEIGLLVKLCKVLGVDDEDEARPTRARGGGG